MWSDNRIRSFPQWIIRRQGLGISHIESCAADLLRFQGLNQGGLVNDRPTGDVRNEGTGGVGLVEDFKFRGGEEVGCRFAVGWLAESRYCRESESRSEHIWSIIICAGPCKAEGMETILTSMVQQ